MNTGPYGEYVLAQILRGEARARRRRRLGVVTGAGSIAAAVTTAVVLSATPAAADVEITVRGDFVHVELVDLVTAEEIRSAFEDEGLQAEVEEVPAGPSAVGKFIAVSLESGQHEVHHRTDSGAFTEFDVRAGWNGVLTIVVGREAEDDEPYERFSDPFDSTEVLFCAGVLGSRLGDVIDQLEGLDVRVRVFEGDAMSSQSDLDRALPTYADLTVVDGARLSRDSVVLDVTNAAPFKERGC